MQTAIFCLLLFCFAQAQYFVGKIDTIAGGSDGDGNNALNVIATPAGLAHDANQNVVYFADATKNKVRMWNKNTNIVTTIAGNLHFFFTF